MASLPIEVKFAQNLAGNEKKTRDKAVKKLKKYLKLKSSSKNGPFSEEDFLKIWKGLHYCMWMQDKAIVQEELSTTLSKLVHDLSTTEQQLLFLKTFFTTEAREWNGIDVWRLDKFMMLVRHVLHEALIVVQKLNWTSEHMETLTSVMYDTVMSPTNDAIPDGLKLHLSDVYLDEVETVAGSKLNGSQLVQMLQPFFLFLQKNKNSVLAKRVVSRVLEPIITRTVELAKQEEVVEVGEDPPKIQYEQLQFDLGLIANHVFELSKGSDCLSRNRPMLYSLVKRCRDIVDGRLPQPEDIKVDPALTHWDMSKAIQKLTNVEVAEIAGRQKKRRKRRNGDVGSGDDETDMATDPNNNLTEDSMSDSDIEDDDMVFPETSDSSRKTGKRKLSLTSETESSEPLTKVKKTSVGKENLEENTCGGDEDKSNKVVSKSPKDKKNKKLLMSKLSKMIKNKSGSDTPKSASKKGKVDYRTVIHVGKHSEAGTPKSPWKVTDTPKKTSNSVSEKGSEKVKHEPTMTQTINEKAKTPEKSGKRRHDSSSARKERRSVDEVVENNVTVTPKDANKNKAKTPEKSKKSKKAESKHSEVEHTKLKLPGIAVDNADGTTHSKTTTDKLQDGEIEIWVPNKKYKGGNDLKNNADTNSALKSSATPKAVSETAAKSKFAKFDTSKPPAAFVKKAMVKAQKSSSTSNIPPKTPSLLAPEKPGGSAKKVSFNMNKNKAVAFKDSVQFSPLPQFHPDRKPDQGILKSPAEGALIPATSMRNRTQYLKTTPVAALQRKNALKRKVPGKAVRRAKASDFFLL